MKFLTLLEAFSIKEIESPILYSSGVSAKGYSAIYIPELNLVIKFDGEHHSTFFEQFKSDIEKLVNYKQIIRELSKKYNVTDLIRIAKTYMRAYDFFKRMKWIWIYYNGYETISINATSNDQFENIISIYFYLENNITKLDKVVIDINGDYIFINLDEGQKFPTIATQLKELFTKSKSL